MNQKTKIPIITIAAYSGTGKTTFLVQLIPVLKRRGLRVAVIKHDAHEFEIDKDGKDSKRITLAGADITGLVSKQKSVLMENRKVELEDFISKINNVDVILTEGFKHEKYPKIMLHREATGHSFPVRPEECLAVVSDVPVPDANIRYQWNDIEGIADLICREIDFGGKSK